MTRVAFLWHMHQPFYQDLLTGEHVLPWVRLHALKDYWGMVAVLREFPGVKATFNLVPSLLVQLEAYAREEARDRHLELGLKPAANLSEEERTFCVQEFFHAHRRRMIDPYPRYRELAEQRESHGPGLSARSQAAPFSVDDLRDLQVWHKLVWLDPDYHERDDRVRALVAKGRGFTEDDKATLRAIELELLRKVIPEYAAAAGRGQVELSASPFYHPILPLLCDTDVYLRTHPHSRMPRAPFRYPGDAAEQLERAAALHQRLLGRRPAGLWPSEGSVSDAMVPLVADAGFRWMATDEEILAKTLGAAFTRGAEGHLDQPEVLYRPYRVGREGVQVACGFRDHALSDLIGFSYASWSAQGAADDFVHRLAAAGHRYSNRTGGGEATIFVILDGENAWEYYDSQGRPFLRALYGKLENHPELQTVTMSEACAGATGALPSIFPGSWINGDFYIWIGHPDDHRAWSQLADARRTLDAASGAAAPQALAHAREEILIAEGSDWFWWYGDDHSSEHDLEFDEVFRRHVRNVYRALDRPVPEELFVTNISTAPPDVRIEAPTGLIQPAVDGEMTSYFEWLGAGCVEASRTAGAMHQVMDRATIVTIVQFGAGLRDLFIRVDGTQPMRRHLESGVELRIKFLRPALIQVVLGMAARPGSGQALTVRFEERLAEGNWTARECAGLVAAAADIVEVQVPFACLGATVPGAVAFLLAVNQDGLEVEQHPRNGPIEIDLPAPEVPARN
jgi:alpha-amylase/alpha-mannosidase (GH57 family)